MLAVLKRELRGYFNNLTGYILIAFLLAVIGFFTSVFNLQSALSGFEYALYPSLLVFLVAVPLLTMRTIAADRGKTDQLLLTAPVGTMGMVFGKWLATVVVFAIPMLVISTYPLFLARYGSVPFGSAYGMVIGFFCLGTALISIGVFISSLTESQIIAAVLTFGVLLLLYFMDRIVALVGNPSSVVAQGISTVLGWFALFQGMDGFSKGIFDITEVLYYVSISMLFLFFTVQSIEKRRWT